MYDEEVIKKKMLVVFDIYKRLYKREKTKHNGQTLIEFDMCEENWRIIGAAEELELRLEDMYERFSKLLFEMVDGEWRCLPLAQSPWSDRHISFCFGSLPDEPNWFDFAYREFAKSIREVDMQIAAQRELEVAHEASLKLKKRDSIRGERHPQEPHMEMRRNRGPTRFEEKNQVPPSSNYSQLLGQVTWQDGPKSYDDVLSSRQSGPSTAVDGKARKVQKPKSVLEELFPNVKREEQSDSILLKLFPQLHLHQEEEVKGKRVSVEELMGISKKSNRN